MSWPPKPNASTGEKRAAKTQAVESENDEVRNMTEESET